MSVAFPVVSSFSNLNQYIAYVNKIPNLSHEEEISLLTQYKNTNDVKAAEKITLAHLKFVVAVARKYLGYGVSHEDLIQEGNIGLMKAIKKFDIAAGVRVVTFAIFHIKSEITEFIIKNVRIVKNVTTKEHRKLFFNYRNMRSEESMLNNGLTQADAEMISKELDIPIDKVRAAPEMFASDKSVIVGPDGEEVCIFDAMADDRWEPTMVLERAEDEEKLKSILEIVKTLDERERIIIQKRWLADEKTTLSELSKELGISMERIRQIEERAIGKIRKLSTRIL